MTKLSIPDPEEGTGTSSGSTSTSSSSSIVSHGGMVTTTTGAGPWDSPIGLKKQPKLVGLPPRFTDKILLAILDQENGDGEDTAIWAAKLKPINVSINFDDDGTGRLTIELSLIDVYKNNV